MRGNEWFFPLGQGSSPWPLIHVCTGDYTRRLIAVSSPSEKCFRAMFNVFVEIGGEFIRIDTEEDLRRLHELIGWRLSVGDTAKSARVLDAEGVRGVNALVGLRNNGKKPLPPVKPSDTLPPKTTLPPKSERTIDYALQVLATVTNGVRIDTLTRLMKKAGWVTTSASPERIVYITLKKRIYEHLFEYDPKRGWSLRK